MSEVTSYLRDRLARETLRYAVGRAMYCPHCDAVLDAESAVLLSHGSACAILCAPCYGNAPWSGTAGAVEVLDGRTLWEPRGKGARSRQWMAA